MPATAAFLGGALGLGVQLYSNAARRLPAMRHPWEHLLAIGLGSSFGNWLVKWEENLQVDLDKSVEEAKNANKKRYLGTMRVQQEED
ncbi:unnamed protein product [Calypogeia fissa]